jgi:hypothetical protein
LRDGARAVPFSFSALGRPNSMSGVAFDRAAFLQEHFTEMSNGVGKNVGLIFFRYKSQNHVRKAFGHAGSKIGGVWRLSPFNVLLHDVVDIAVQAIRHEMTRFVPDTSTYMAI